MAIHSPSFDYIALLQTDILTIIFDTCASMSISLYKMDFVGTITPLQEPRTLVGMGYGTPIYGIGLVQWRFHKGDTTLTIHAHCYHIPNDCAHSLIPQQLFITSGRANGIFTIGDMCSTLSLDGKPSLQNPYDSNSYLPVSLAHNATASASPTEVNMSVLSEKNTNLTPSPKLLLLCHKKFGDRNMQSTQQMFCHFHTFNCPKFTGSAKY